MGLTAHAANLAPALAHFVPVCCRPVPSRGQVVNIVQQTTKLDGNGEGHCQSARSYRGRPRPMKLCGHACVPPCRPCLILNPKTGFLGSDGWMPGDYGALESVWTLDGEIQTFTDRRNWVSAHTHTHTCTRLPGSQERAHCKLSGNITP